MEKLTLELLFHIIGIGSASGIIYKDNSLFIVGDNSGFLYEYHIDSQHLRRHPLIENPSENIPKKDKPDFEALTCFQDSMYAFGSGSTSKRNLMVEFDLAQKKKIATNNLTNLYAAMQNFASIKAEDFNIEGVIHDGENWYFLNRGNGISNKNTLFSFHTKKLNQEFNMRSNDYELPKINGIVSSFTDAVLVDGKIYFLATAEDTQSTYDDGEVLGSIIGRIDLETMKIDFTQKISNNHKFEGLTIFKKDNNKIEFLLCEDKDTEILETAIYKLSLNLK
jgi:hypothetical protein